ncbi:hypothetical protein, partial [uncultured Muribaculum sp.]
PGGVTLNGFQDRRNRPLCHLSKWMLLFTGAKLWFYCEITKYFDGFILRSGLKSCRNAYLASFRRGEWGDDWIIIHNFAGDEEGVFVQS